MGSEKVPVGAEKNSCGCIKGSLAYSKKNFWLHNMQKIYKLFEKLLVSQEELF